MDLPAFFTADPFVRFFGHPQVDISGKSNPTPTPGVAVFVPKRFWREENGDQSDHFLENICF